MADLFPITEEDAVVEIDRELAMRRRVYAKQVADGRLSQDVADRRIRILEWVREQLIARRS